MFHHPTCSSPVDSHDVLDVIDDSQRSDKLGFNHLPGSVSNSSYVTSTPFWSEFAGVNRISATHADSGFSTIFKPLGRRLVNSDDLPRLPFLLDSATDTASSCSLLSVSPMSGSSLLASLTESSELLDSGCFSGFSEHDSQTIPILDSAAGDLASRVCSDVESLPGSVKPDYQVPDGNETAQVDFINELHNLPHVLRKLLGFLSEDDLLRYTALSFFYISDP
jgi:hypothetical protein